MIIHPATEQDFGRIAEIYNTAHTPLWDIYSQEERDAFGRETESADSIRIMSTVKIIWVIEDGATIKGYTAFRFKNPTVIWISSLYIDPTQQGSGLGAQLMKSVEEFAKENNAAIVALETHQLATWAINFYTKHGYIDVKDMLSEFPFDQILEKPPVANRPLLAKLIV